MTTRAEHVADVLDRVLPLLPLGVHRRELDDRVELIALGERNALWPLDGLAEACGSLLLEPPREEEAGDLHDEIDRLRPGFDIGGRIVVRAPLADEPTDDRIDIVIDRSYGFGTGAHPTTRMSLELLLDLEPRGAFADLGCGAGAIVIAASKLGWGPVAGLDFNPHGIEEAKANLERNGVEADVRVADLRRAPIPSVTAAVANVSEPDVHERLATVDWNGLETLIISGLKAGQELEPALERYEAAGFTERDRRTYGLWAAVRLERTTEPTTPGGTLS